VPPKPAPESDAVPVRVEPGDTASLVASAAVELMAQAAPLADPSEEGDTEHGDTERAAIPIVAHDPSVAKATPSEPKRRGAGFWLPIAGAAAVIFVLIVWLALRGDDESETVVVAPETVGSTSRAAPPGGDDMDEGALPAAVADEMASSTGASRSGSDTSSDSGSGSSSAGETTAEPETDSTSSGPGHTSTGGDGDTDELEFEDDPIEAASGSRSKPKPPKKPRPGVDPKPTTSPEPPTKPATQPKPETETKDAAKLLSRAKAAYRKGNSSSAYTLASKSNRLEPSTEAAELRVLAACQMNAPDKARNALWAVPLLRRTGVRSICKSKHGVRMGL